MNDAKTAASTRPRFEFPHSLVLIFGMIVLAQIAGYLLQSGEFERDGRRVVPGTYAVVDADPLPWHAFLTKIPRGLSEAGEIIFFVLLIGGVLGILRATGVIDALISTAIGRFKESRTGLIIIVLSVFALGSATIGMAEEYLPFMPILITLCLALGMDAVVALSLIVVGYGVGYAAAPLNPFTVQIAQDIAGLTPTSGQGFRWLLLLALFGVGLHHILRYVKKLQADPSSSLVADIDYSEGFEQPQTTALTVRRRIVLVLFVASIAIFAYGSSELSGWGWYLTELSGLFLALGILAAVVAKLHPNVAANSFCSGATDLAATAILIGFARTIEVMLSDARVIDTIVFHVSNLLEGASPSIAAIGMLFVQCICNFLIPSGSGQAYVTMPLMAPLGDVLGVPRQVSVLAYQFGDGFTNTLVPTNAILMGLLAFARIPYQRWLKFIVPLLLKAFLVASLALVVAIWIGYN